MPSAEPAPPVSHGYSMWLPQQEKREAMQFKGVVNFAALTQSLYSVDGRRNCIRSLAFLHSFPTPTLGVVYFTCGGCSTLVLLLCPVTVLCLLIVLAVPDLPNHSPSLVLGLVVISTDTLFFFA
jgi:hypothetical protein